MAFTIFHNTGSNYRKVWGLDAKFIADDVESAP